MTAVHRDNAAFDINEVNAKDPAVSEVLGRFNDMFVDDFYPLESKHFEDGHWLIVTTREPTCKLVAFAGSVPFRPFDNFLYFKRVAVLPEYRGQALQRTLMQCTEGLARKVGRYSHMVSTTDLENVHSANNFVACGWKMTRPEKPWEDAQSPSIYWIKKL